MKSKETTQTCEVCHENIGTKRITINGRYYRSVCSPCAQSSYRGKNDAQFQREANARDNAKDIQQPWNPDGTPNQLFIEAYPDVAKITYTREELEANDNKV